MESRPPRKVIITIDGPAGSGKSTLARSLANELGITYLDTGSTYRALAIKALRESIDFDDEAGTAQLAVRLNISFKPAHDGEKKARVFLDGSEITDHLSNNEVSVAASKISRHPRVRGAMVELQRRLAEIEILAEAEHPSRLAGIVAEGRDTGTVVFPDATVKIFLIASLETRARRRLPDFEGKNMSLEDIMAAIEARDHSDEGRITGPLIQAVDAIALDSTNNTPEQTLRQALKIVRDILDLQR
jgi:CMP/dCMP kinase